jgi:transcriptional regulator with XRE-family HTH domain
MSVAKGQRIGEPVDPGIGVVLHNRRRSLGLSLGDIARETGASPIILSRLERGKQSVSFERMCRIADILAISLDALAHHQCRARQEA